MNTYSKHKIKMVRPKIQRKINYSAKISYFKPMGVGFSESKEIVMSNEEIESLRLIEIKELEQKDAAKSMKISQPTFSRTLKSARNKAAEAIVNGKAIKISGGNVLIKSSFSLKDLKDIQNPKQDFCETIPLYFQRIAI